MHAVQLEKFIMKKVFTAAVVAMTLVFSVPLYAEQQAESEMPVSNAIYDILLMRPVGAISLGVGAAAFIISLPITLPLGEAGISAYELVVVPFNYTFTRPIGDLWLSELQEWEKERRRQEAEGRRLYPRQGRGWDE